MPRTAPQLADDDADGYLIGGQAGLPPSWLRGGVEAPAGTKDMGSWTARVYTAEQQARLGVDEFGKKTQKPDFSKKVKGVQALPPAWVTGGIEAPAGTKDMGGWTAAVYTAEQQARLGVDEQGNKKKPDFSKKVKGITGGQAGLAPGWLRGDMEAPAGTKDMGTWTAAVYTAEQQARLGVDEAGNKIEHQPARMVGGQGGLPPAWLRGDMEAPAGEKNMGTWTAAVYTEEQQARLGVDNLGTPKNKKVKGVQALPPAWVTGGIEAPAGTKDMGG